MGGSIKNNPFLKGTTIKSFKRTPKQTSEENKPKVKSGRISNVLDAWKARQDKLDEERAQKGIPAKLDIYGSNPEVFVNPYQNQNEEKKTEKIEIKTEKPSLIERQLKDKKDELRLIESKLSLSKQQNDALNKDNETLQKEINAFKQSNNMLEENNKKHNDDKSGKDEIASLTQQIEALEKEKDAMGNDKEREKLIKVLKNRVDQMKLNVSKRKKMKKYRN